MKKHRLSHLLVGAGLGLVAWGGVGHADTFVVGNLNDSGLGSLREAITKTNTTAGGDIINATGLNGSLQLLSSLPALNGDVTINGPGAGKLTIDGKLSYTALNFGVGNSAVSGITFVGCKGHYGPAVRKTGAGSLQVSNCVFNNNREYRGAAAYAETSSISFTTCTFTGNVATNGGGGAIHVSNAAALTVSGCTFSGNSAADDGGAVAITYNAAAASITNSIFTNNTSREQGGGLYTRGPQLQTITRCRFISNQAVEGGGAYVDDSPARMTDCTFDGNVASSEGGGLSVRYGEASAVITGSTFSNNRATAGGGIFNRENVQLINCTVSGNTATNYGGIASNPASSTDFTQIKNCTITNNNANGGTAGGVRSDNLNTRVFSSIIAGNSALNANPDVEGNFTSQGFNLIGDSGNTTAFVQATDQVGNSATAVINPNLGALANNGGPTQTHALLTGSKAIDKGSSGGLTTDQRGSGFPRIVDQAGIANAGDGSDVGAYELLRNPSLRISDVTKQEGNSGTTAFVFTVSLSKPPAQPVTVNYATAPGTTRPAVAGDDYNPTNGTLTFNPGAGLTQTVTVQVNGDTALEADETFIVRLSGATRATIADSQGVGTIGNDDASSPAPRLVITDVVSVEGHDGLTHMVFTVNVLEPNGQQIKVRYATVDGTATVAGNDYVATTGTLTISPGQTHGIIDIPVRGDTAVEANESFTVRLRSPVNATILDAQGKGTIRNDDSATSTGASESPSSSASL